MSHKATGSNCAVESEKPQGEKLTRWLRLYLLLGARVRWMGIFNQNAKQESSTGVKLRYRLLTGVDDSSFCQRVSDALDEGYVLAGSPAITFDGESRIVAQAVILPRL